MTITEFIYNDQLLKGLEVTKEELINIIKKCDYVPVSTESDELIETLSDKDIVGAIFGDIDNILIDTETKCDIPICENPYCWFVNDKVLKENYKKLKETK